jgi:8-oxo-dGTP diphosphatase
MKPFCYKYPRPMVTADAVVFNRYEPVPALLLILRNNEPYKNCWALPGGFVDMDEDLETAARRELEEETGLQIGEMVQVGAFGTPGRDPRGRNICIAYGAEIKLENPLVAGGDDAGDARFFSIDALPELAFDHRDIIARAAHIFRISLP